MTNQKPLDILMQGREVWNRWRSEHPDIRPDLRRADLRGAYLSRTLLRRADLSGANLSGANLSQADLSGANLHKALLSRAYLSNANLREADLIKANLREADLSGASLHKANLHKALLIEADLSEANLSEVNLSGADLSHANLREANLSEANLSHANLSHANLISAILVETNFAKATLAGCRVYGISAWDINLEATDQSDLIITRFNEPTITVDNLEVAQFIYLLLNNQKIRDVIKTITTKAVLILGHFTPERKAVLDAIREELRRHDYLPILFDFEQPSSRNLTETVATLAHMASFIIADITDAKSIPQELQRIVPDLPSLPVQPLILASEDEYVMSKDFGDYPWVLAPYRYHSLEELVASLEEKVITPAVIKANEIEESRRRA